MARIVIMAYGSRGDLLPLTDIACRLRDHGHDVVMTSTPDLAADIEACGISVLPIDIQVGEPDDVAKNPMKAARALVSPTGMRQLGRALVSVLHDTPADVLLLSPFAELAGHPLAEARGIPAIGVRMQPISTTSAYPPSLLGGWSAGPVWNRVAGRLSAAAVDRIYGTVVRDFRSDLGLPSLSARSMRSRRTGARWPVLHGFSPNVVARPEDWRPGLEVVGYWWPRHRPEWSPASELSDFLAEGSAPVFIGLGSLMVSDRESRRISATVQAALDTVGVRGVVQAGGARLSVKADGVITVGDVPHEWLFEHVAAVAHSCGAGVTAAGLRAGLPAVTLPSPGGDQPFWARRLRQLGVSPAPVPRPKLTATRLARAIDSVLAEPGPRDRARELAELIAAEDGAANVVAVVERLVGV